MFMQFKAIIWTHLETAWVMWDHAHTDDAKEVLWQYRWNKYICCTSMVATYKQKYWGKLSTNQISNN